jgi:hypothetical protein
MNIRKGLSTEGQTTASEPDFPQTLQTPFSLIVPMQLPSRQRILSDGSDSLSCLFIIFPHWQQYKPFSGVSPPHSEQMT